MSEKRRLFPKIEPFNIGGLKVSDLHEVIYEQVGNPKGHPAVFLHGGPGVGITPAYRRFFDPEFYHVVLLDQRGAGRSTPHAELRENTTWDLVEDLEKLRTHLNLDPWVVMGGSWGSTLALCYAIKYPTSVRGIIIRGIFLATQAERDWLFRPGGASEIFPDYWQDFIDHIPTKERDDLLSAYAKRLSSQDPEEVRAAAQAWTRWEGSIVTLLPNSQELKSMLADKSALSIARAECHYSVKDFFLPTDTYLLDNLDKLSDIPVRIVQGRYDIVCPVKAAWNLHRGLKQSELRIVDDGSHSPLESGMIHELVQGADDFKELFN